MIAPIQQTVSKLTSLLEIQYIYLLEIGEGSGSRSLFILLLGTSCPPLSKELSSNIDNIFQDMPNCLYRIFTFDYALGQLKGQNLFFVHGCARSNLVYSDPKLEADLFDHCDADELLLSKVHLNFKGKLDKIGSFMEGAVFFLEKGILSQSAFMLHQFIELLFRNMELIMMGKERKCHSIKEHQNFIKAFVPELGNLFDTETEEGRNLLKLLDDAYTATRHDTNYSINPEQIQYIREKADWLYKQVAQRFEDKLDSCRKKQDKQHVFKASDPMEARDPKKSIPNSNEKELLGRIKDFAHEHYELLKPYKRGLYKVELLCEGYLEVSFMISNLLKVCILAINSDDNYERLIPEPSHNIQEVLKYILELIPYEEMELLDKLKKVLQSENSNGTDFIKTS